MQFRGFRVDVLKHVSPLRSVVLKRIKEAVFVARSVASFGLVPLLHVSAVMPTDVIRCCHHSAKHLFVHCGDIFERFRSSPESLHAPFLLIGPGQAEAAVTIEDRFSGRFIDHVAQFSVFFPWPVRLHADHVDMLFHCRQHEIVVPHQRGLRNVARGHVRTEI